MTISTPAPESTKFADRIFVLDGGQAHVTDVSQWSPGVNADHDKSRSLMDRFDSLARHERAALLISHDARRSVLIRRSPDSIE